MSPSTMESHLQDKGGSALVLIVLIFVGLVPVSTEALGISRLQARELLVPLLFGLTLVDLALVTKRLSLFRPAPGNLQLLFVAMFMFVVLSSFARNPQLPSSMTGGKEGAFKLYWQFFGAFLTYLMIIYWSNRNRISAERLLKVLLYISIGVTVAGMFMMLTGMKIPGLDTHAWSVSETRGTGGAAGSVRAPFIESFGQIGFFLVLGHVGFSGRLRWALLVFFIYCIFIGGGRATVISTFAGAIVWLFLNRKYLLFSAVTLSVALLLIFASLINEIAPSPQLSRLTRIGSLEEASHGRHIVNEYLVDEFKRNPVFGTGYGKDYDLPLIRLRDRFEDPDRIEQQLKTGSHGTHLQLLKNLGVVGYLAFMLIWLYSLFKLLPAAMLREHEYPDKLSDEARLCIVIISSLLVQMLVTGNGSETRIYIFAAVICGVISEVCLKSLQRRPQGLLTRETGAARFDSS